MLSELLPVRGRPRQATQPHSPHISTELVLVSIRAMKEALFRGIDAFLIDAFADKARASTIEEGCDPPVAVESRGFRGFSGDTGPGAGFWG
jgi:hypothetical protein